MGQLLEYEVLNDAHGPTKSAPLLTVRDVAGMLRLTEKGIYSLVAGRRIPFIKVSNRVRFLHSDVLAWLRKNRVPTVEDHR